ncbi:hypothetical protein M3484_20870 [Pseudomonas sp. GX19020]|uniref:hypothetical protein n=1 Tax=Pseudomonas sp. GX19020 TaxID=2942277 RepID=UPI002019468B|nr:hypothetical protein [Pseudomonas sp. GX19020]MCL4069014.1 hypothetical protein [Pseudomonas sp. GX19020]
MDIGLEMAVDGLVKEGLARQASALQSVAAMLRIALPGSTEIARLRALRSRAVPPASCGEDMPVAPARGPVVAFQPKQPVLMDDGRHEVHAGWLGRDAGRASDAFDRMADQSRRAGGVDPFLPFHKLTARTYAALVERHSCVGLKGRSFETMMGGRSGGGGDGVMDLILDEGATIDAMRRAAGDGWALEVRRQGKRRRVPLTVLDLVDRVCLQDKTIGEVLRACGWSEKGETRAWAQDALCGALERMSKRVQLEA